jgi:hypothetical protein
VKDSFGLRRVMFVLSSEEPLLILAADTPLTDVLRDEVGHEGRAGPMLRCLPKCGRVEGSGGVVVF